MKAELRIAGVDDPVAFEPPADIAFTHYSFSGEPNRSSNAILLVNPLAFAGFPEIRFGLDDIVGRITLSGEREAYSLQVHAGHVIAERNVARLVIPFFSPGWGQSATLVATAVRADRHVATAKCKLKFEHPPGKDRFTNFHYEDLGRPVMADVAGDKIYVNSGYSLHREIFGDTEDDFNRRLEAEPLAQIRAASVLVETMVLHTASTKYRAGGKKGLHLDPDDPIGTLRPYLDESRIKLEPKVYGALIAR